LHCSEVCPQQSLGMLFCKQLEDPHSACLLDRLSYID
jgi:hypothetical protein